jgi:hypothetical protein
MELEEAGDENSEQDRGGEVAQPEPAAKEN